VRVPSKGQGLVRDAIYEIGADSPKRITRAMPRKGPLRRRVPRTVKINNTAGSDEVFEPAPLLKPP